ncbi:MAG: phosphoribosyltransferase [Spirochaetales bacterium]|nr:phosphoribosyltransferase [Candidatus Physcosoma equi]
MAKEFIAHDTIRDAALKLAYKMYKEDHYIPDVIYVSLRGGVYMANVFSEFYKLVCEKEHHARPTLYAAVVARSRKALIPGEDTKVFVDGWTYSPDYLRVGDKVLLVDDIFDTGNTINQLAKVIMDKGIPRSDLKIAVYDYKVPVYKFDKVKPLPIQPDYWCRKLVLNGPEEEKWTHYLCHEFVGLTDEEIDEAYQDPEVRAILHEMAK